MNKSLLSQLLDGAAFPAIMLAVAVSQMTTTPEQGNTTGQSKRVTNALTAANRGEQTAKGAQDKWDFYRR